MPIFIGISRHSPESCPITNEKERKFAMEAAAKTEELTKKYGIKMLGSYTVMPEHALYLIMEAPSADAMMRCMNEPFMLLFFAHNMNELKFAMTLEESMKMLTQIPG